MPKQERLSGTVSDPALDAPSKPRRARLRLPALGLFSAALAVSAAATLLDARPVYASAGVVLAGLALTVLVLARA